MTKRCFEQDCTLDVEYECQCSTPEIYSCSMHLQRHLCTSNRNHIISSVYLAPIEETKKAIIELLNKEIEKRNKLKNKLFEALRQSNWDLQNSAKENIKKLSNDIYEISNCAEKIFNTQKISKSEKDPLLSLLTLQPDAARESIKTLIPIYSKSYHTFKLFCGLSEEIEKMIKCFIQEKFENFLKIKLDDIEKKFEDNNKVISDNLNQNIADLTGKIKKNKKSIQLKLENQEKKFDSQLKLVNDNNKKAIEDLKNDIQQQIDNQKNFDIQQQIDNQKNFDSRLNLAKDDLIKEIKKINNELAISKQSILNLADENKKDKEKFQNLENLNNSQLQQVTLLNSQLNQVNQDILDLDKKQRADNYNLLKHSISGFADEIEKTKEKIDNLNREIELKIQNQTNLFESQLNSVSMKLSKAKKSQRKYNWINFNQFYNFQELNYGRFVNEKFSDKIYNEYLPYEDSSSTYNPSKADQEIIRDLSTLYLINEVNDRTNLNVYDFENKKRDVKLLNMHEKLNYGSCIAQLPDSEFFCFGRYPSSGITLIIDKNYSVRLLSSGTPCCYSSAIFLDNKIYCFGGKNINVLALSEKFDLNENRWIKLTPMPKEDKQCQCIIFKKNILIGGFFNKNILKYSICSNNFTAIPFDFSEGKRKVLINSNERLYLIECNGLIYESEADDENKWNQIASLEFAYAIQMYYSLNKGGICLKTKGRSIYEEITTIGVRKGFISLLAESPKNEEKEFENQETHPKFLSEKGPKSSNEKYWNDLMLKNHNIPTIKLSTRKMSSDSDEESYSSSDSEVSLSHHRNINDSSQGDFLYLIYQDNNKTYLSIYDIENDEEDERELDTPESLDHCVCIAQLPNCELFCFGKKDPLSGISLIIDYKNWSIRKLPPGKPCYFSSSIYFDRNIYCFGGVSKNFDSTTLSEKFDLDRNIWISLAPLPQADGGCHCIEYNRNILIAGFESQNLLQYSIDNNSFLVIDFQFEKLKRKILINAERFYLIECGGFIFESEIRDYTKWKQIGDSIIKNNYPAQIYSLVNKRDAFIGSKNPDKIYKFSLDTKIMNKV